MSAPNAQLTTAPRAPHEEPAIVAAGRGSPTDDKDSKKFGSSDEERQQERTVAEIEESQTLPEGPTTGKYEEWAYVSFPLQDLLDEMNLRVR